MLRDFFVRGFPGVNRLYLIRLGVAEQGLLKIGLFIKKFCFYQQPFLRNSMSKYVCPPSVLFDLNPSPNQFNFCTFSEHTGGCNLLVKALHLAELSLIPVL